MVPSRSGSSPAVKRRAAPNDPAPVPDRAAPLASAPPEDLPPDQANDILARAAAKLHQRDPAAADLFDAVARRYDLREAWLGAAVAHHLTGAQLPAAHALAHAMSHHALGVIPPAADEIAAAVRAPGWCALDSAGRLTIRLVRPSHRAALLRARLDGAILTLDGAPGGRSFTACLPDTWRRAYEIQVLLDDDTLLGSPIKLATIARVEGFVSTYNGNLHGWAWCPNDPDWDPVLSVASLDGSPTMNVTAADPSAPMEAHVPLARQRGFQIPASQLLRFDGPVRVRGADGRDLTGSPLDPSAERRSAASTARIFAELFPADRPSSRPASRELSFLSVPAHVIGGPVEGGFTRRPVDIVVPVYNGLEQTLACLDSVLADLPRWARLVVVNDASPDPRVARELGKLAARHRITLLTQPVNQGFPGTANLGMRHDPTRDVVLLNSDTLVPPGWLTSLREAAYAAPDIGSATPLSNDASILSYPSVDHPNDMPDLTTTIALDALAQRANAGQLVDVPTAVGFCVYLKRDCLTATGLLRDDIFAQGYGEENDFCIRARHLGWRHVAVPSVFVAHVGGHSFGFAKRHLIARNMGVLNQLHPGYDTLIQDFRRHDPLAEHRRRLDLERWKTFRSRSRSVLLVTHGRGGGVRRHVAERAAALRAEGLRPIVLWPVASRHGTGRDCVLGNGPEGGTPNLRFAIPGELDLLARVLKADRPLGAEVHHMIGHDHALMELFARLSIPYDIVVHDYSWLCPRINLVGADHRYCGEPDLAGCEACIADAGPTNEETTSPRALRERSAQEMEAAASIIAPSDDVAARIVRHFPRVRPRVVNWETDQDVPPATPAPPAADGLRRVCVVGAIGIEKGYDLLLACARDAANRDLPLRFHLVGYSCDDARLIATGRVEITGEYEEHQAVVLIRRQQAQLAWLPSLWPETWCYTLSQAWQAGLDVLAFDLGTPALRIRRTGRGWLVPLGLAPRGLNNRMLAAPPIEPTVVRTERVPQPRHDRTLLLAHG